MKNDRAVSSVPALQQQQELMASQAGPHISSSNLIGMAPNARFFFIHIYSHVMWTSIVRVFTLELVAISF
jgi:hypothetical protein